MKKNSCSEGVRVACVLMLRRGKAAYAAESVMSSLVRTLVLILYAIDPVSQNLL